MKIREFNKSDAEFCFRTRTNAFIKFFYEELGADVVSLCVNSILPEEYIKLSAKIKLFILEENDQQLGFVSAKLIDKTTAELPLIYFSPEFVGKGFGSKSINFIENWIKNNWVQVDSIILDTIIPNYNGRFYEKMGYQKESDSFCSFLATKVPAIRYKKKL